MSDLIPVIPGVRSLLYGDLGAQESLFQNLCITSEIVWKIQKGKLKVSWLFEGDLWNTDWDQPEMSSQ